ncbi:MAG: copper resistance protein CopC [Dehalococcoidia bacterium]
MIRPRSTGLTIALVLLLALASAARPTTVAAHANLEQSDPPAQATVPFAPEQVRLSFTEPVEPRQIEVSVLDPLRKRVDRGDAALAQGTDNGVAVSLQPGLSAGVYTIEWKMVSAVDGHTTRGLIPFSVGEVANVVEPVTTTASSGGVLGVVGRWLTVLAAITVIGLLAFVPLVLVPGLRALDGLQETASAPAGGRPRRRPSPEGSGVTAAAIEQVADVAVRRIVRLAWTALALFAVGAVLLLVAETQTANDGSLLEALGRPMWEQLTTSQRGTLWLWRAGLIVALAAALEIMVELVGRQGRRAVERRWAWALLVALGAGALLAHSLGSHAAALRAQTAVAVAMSFIHLLAVAAWVGGLIGLGLGLLPALAPLGGPPRTRLLSSLVPRFSLVAGVSVAIITLSGIYQTVRLLGGIDALLSAAWGRTLVIKLLVFVLILPLAAFNLLWVSRRLRVLAQQIDRPAREAAARVRLHFRRAVLAEIGLAMVVLLVVGILTGNSPGRATTAAAGGPYRPFILNVAAEDLKGRLVLSPGRIGLNRFDLTVTDAAGRPIGAGASALLRISTLDQDTGINEATMEAQSGGRFTATGTYLSTVGLWEVAALVRRPDKDEVRLPFQLSLTSLTGQAEVRDNRPAAPIERGRELFAANCAQCHGAGGRGDGPLAPGLSPRPVDLTVHVPLHGDRELYDWIANGVPRTAMPAWKGVFTDEEIQAIINHLRQVAEQAGASR